MTPRPRNAPSADTTEPEVLGAGGPRSERTRRTILESARQTFAARGYEQTTIRAVAAQARIDASMVMRYFGSKAGLFAAASTTHLQIPDLGGVPRSQRGEFMVRHFVERWERSPGNDALVFLLRTAVTNDAVADQLQSKFNELIAAPIAALGVSHPERRGALVGSQLLGVVLCRYILHLEPIASSTAEEVITGIAPAVQLHLEDRPHGRA